MAFCSNCGQELTEGMKFCNNCGTPTGATQAQKEKTVTPSPIEPQKVEESKKEYMGEQPLTERKTIYEGTLHKCPNCGEVLSAFVVNCPSCGYEIRGGNTSSSAREFAVRLVDATNDEQKITLIKSFPIPNSKEDILEFMVVASTNFDASASLSGNGMKKSVSDAWLSKVEQSYQKAMLLFVNDPDFSKIQNVYDQVCSKIKETTAYAKKKRIIQTTLRTIGLWGGLLVFFIAFIIDISSAFANTSMLHLGGALVLIIGACTSGRKKEMIDVGIGAIACVLTILLGMLLQESFLGNGSLMVLGGGLSLVIVIVQLFRCAGKKQ